MVVVLDSLLSGTGVCSVSAVAVHETDLHHFLNVLGLRVFVELVWIVHALLPFDGVQRLFSFSSAVVSQIGNETSMSCQLRELLHLTIIYLIQIIE